MSGAFKKKAARLSGDECFVVGEGGPDLAARGESAFAIPLSAGSPRCYHGGCENWAPYSSKTWLTDLCGSWASAVFLINISWLKNTSACRVTSNCSIVTFLTLKADRGRYGYARIGICRSFKPISSAIVLHMLTKGTCRCSKV